MKEVERVSLGGYPFAFEEDAANRAEQYLGELEKYYDGRTGGGEILDGIEERMAELLLEQAGRDGVVSHAMIEDAIRILGRPEDIEAAAEDGNPGAGSAREEGPAAGTGKPEDGAKADEPRPRRKLYRDLSDKQIAGVCSGLAAYFRADVAMFRILFVVFTLIFAIGNSFLPWNAHFWRGFVWRVSLFGPMLYAILWICMPPAKTVRQRWEQRGEDGTVSGIERSIEKGAKEFEEAVKRVGSSTVWGEFGRLVGKFVGVALLIVGFAGLFAGSLWCFGSGWMGQRVGDGIFGIGRLYDQGLAELRYHVPELARIFTTPGVNILLTLVCFLPFLGILYGALQLLFGFKSPKWHPGLVIFVLWLLSVVALGVLIATGVISSEFSTTL